MDIIKSAIIVAQLNSCLEEMRNIIGDSTPEHIMIDAIIKTDFDYEKALNHVLVQQGTFLSSFINMYDFVL